MAELFQSTHPVRGATTTVAVKACPSDTFQSTHPVRGATLLDLENALILNISIHAPRAGCDASPSFTSPP